MAWVTVLPGGPNDLRHGYTLADVARLARAATATAGTYAADYRDLLETAWSAIVEHLYASAHPPPEHDLYAAGRTAIWSSVRSDQATHGGSSRDNYTPGTARAFQRYWWAYSATASSCETTVVERVALSQILPALTPRERDVIHALAAHGDNAAAAQALGITPAALSQRLIAGRRRLLALWHEGETPTGSWRRTGTTRRRLTAAPEQLGGHCRRGHAFDEANTYVRADGKRTCRRCIADAAARRRSRQQAVAPIRPVALTGYPRTRSAARAANDAVIKTKDQTRTEGEDQR